MNRSWSTASKRSIAAMIVKNSTLLSRRIYVSNHNSNSNNYNNNNNNMKFDSNINNYNNNNNDDYNNNDDDDKDDEKHIDSCRNGLEEGGEGIPKIIVQTADRTYDDVNNVHVNVNEDDNQQEQQQKQEQQKSNMNNNNNNNNNKSDNDNNNNNNNNNYLNKCNNREEATSGFVDACEKFLRHKKQKRMNRLQNCENTNLDMTGKEEAKNLQVEFEWVLRSEVHAILKQLRVILIECAHRFPVPLYENEGKKTEKFVLSVSPEQLKASVTLTGDTITQADICFKLAKAPHHIQRTSILQESPWKLQQVQDAANYLQQAINHIDDVHENCHFKTSDEVLHVVGNILEALRRGRTSLVIPKKKSIDELIKGRNMKSLAPNLSEDLAVSFYLQSHKLIIAIYQLTNIQGTMRFDSYQAEASVQWLNEVLFLFTTALKLCQQLKDKISVFSLYKDFTVGTHPPSSAFTYLN